MNIRRMTREDIPAVVLINCIAGIILPWSPHAYTAELEKPASFNWVAETPAPETLEYIAPLAFPVPSLTYPAGAMAVIGSVTLWNLAGEGEIANLAVHPHFQGQGVGRALMQTALHHAAELGLERILLEVRASNEPAQRLYQSLGFVPEGRRRAYYANGEDAILMSLHRLTA